MRGGEGSIYSWEFSPGFEFFSQFIEFVGNFLLSKITFLPFGILRIREKSNRVNPGEIESEIFSSFLIYYLPFFDVVCKSYGRFNIFHLLLKKKSKCVFLIFPNN